MIYFIIIIISFFCSTALSKPKTQWPIPQKVILEFKEEEKKQKTIPKLRRDRTLPDEYLNQVIHRKKIEILQCAVQLNIPPQDFFVELTILPSGKTTSRLINSKQTNRTVLNCAMRIFNRIQFKKFSGPPIVKSYHFQYNSTEPSIADSSL